MDFTKSKDYAMTLFEATVSALASAPSPHLERVRKACALGETTARPKLACAESKKRGFEKRAYTLNQVLASWNFSVASKESYPKDYL